MYTNDATEISIYKMYSTYVIKTFVSNHGNNNYIIVNRLKIIDKYIILNSL